MGGHFSRPGSITTAQNAYRQSIDDRVVRARSDYETGRWSPFVIAVDSIPVYLLFGTVFGLYYCSPRIGRYVRYVSFTVITCLCLWAITHVRVLGGAYGYAVGLVFSVGIMNSAALLIFNDLTTTFKRWEQKVDNEVSSKADVSQGNSSGSEILTANGNVTARKRATDQADGHKPIPKNYESSSVEQPVRYFWQSYPSGILHRLDWTVDLTTSFRGPGWNWRLRTLGPLSKDSSSEFPKPASYAEKRAFISHTLRNFVILYFSIDLLKVVFMWDPYFVGIAPLSSPPPQYLSRDFPIFSTSPILTRTYRLLLSCTGVIAALNIILLLCPIFYGIILPNTIFRNHIHYTPLSHPALYPPQQNSFLDVLDHGLSGWWGTWWHQMFRFGISEPSRVALERLGWNPKSQKARILQVIIAFTITASLHVAGSYTLYDPSTPISGPFFFFVSQGIGLLAQNYVTKNLLGTYIKHLPRWLRRAGNLLFVAIWFYYTGPLFADDTAAAGLWNFEPVPISLFRGLGFGLKGEGWWCWHGKWIVWWDGRPGDTSWWRRRGWAII